MELRNLRYFVRVAEAGSFSRAALNLHVAQSALSRQIQRLEEEVGAPLLLRTSRGLVLTDAGRLLHEQGAALLRKAAEMMQETRAVSADLQGAVRIGVSPATSEVLPPLIARACTKSFPRVRLTFVEGFSEFIFNQLATQQLDLCLLHNPSSHRGVRAEVLVEESMYLVGPPTAQDELDAACESMDFTSLPMILPNPKHGLRVLIDQAIAERGGSLHVVLQADGVVATRSLVGAGLGFTILPFSTIWQQFETGLVSIARLKGFPIPWHLCLGSRLDQDGSRLIRELMAIVRASVDELLESGFWVQREGSVS